MTLWLDAQISPVMAVWIRMRFDVETMAVRDLELRDAEDPEIYAAVRAANAVAMTKDSDFVELLERYGPAANHLASVRKHDERSARAASHPGVSRGVGPDPARGAARRDWRRLVSV